MELLERKTWLERRSTLEKYFLVAVCIMIMIIVLLIMALNCQLTESCTETKSEYCTSQACIEASDNILHSLNTGINPCDDFYEFACGNTINSLTITEDKLYVDQLSMLTDKITNNLHKLIKEPIQLYDSNSVILAKKYYKACKNEDIIEKHGQTVIKELINDLGGWPVLDGDAWNETNFHWTKLIKNLRQRGLSTGNFISFAVTTDSKNSSKRSIELDQAGFGLAREFLTTGQYVDIYYELMVNVSVELGAQKFRSNKELNESLEFEIQLASLALPEEERRNYSALYNPMTIKELQQNFKTIDWLDYINSLLPSKLQLVESDMVVVAVPEYLKNVQELLQKTSKRVLANYAIWRVIEEVMDYSPISIYKHYLNALRAINGQAERQPRWKECMDGVSNRFSYAVASLYIRKYFDLESITKANQIIKYLKQTFNEMLQNLDWMDSKTRQKALEKADKMVQHVGYPPEILNNEILDDHYKGLEIKDSEYLLSYLRVIKHLTDFAYGRLQEPVNKTDWRSHGESFQVGAYYIPSENSIELSAGILQGIFFNKNRPAYMNFGAIGTIIGHEITHGFDDEGSQLDENGNLINWWEPETESKYLNKVKCIINQYSNYTVKILDKNVNGIRTQGENLADNGGLKEAYLAYNAWIKDNGMELKLPGLNYTSNQLFWISTAMNWCTKYRDDYLNILVAQDSHSPNNFRVIGPMSNSEEFSKDFNCNVNSRMNAINKCSVW